MKHGLHSKYQAILLLTLFLTTGFISLDARQIDFDVTLLPESPAQGQEMQMIISTNSANGLFYFGLEVLFDENAFEFLSIEPGEVMYPDPLSVSGSLESNRTGASVVRTSGESEGEGTIMVLTFRALSDATPGTYTFGLEAPDARNNSGNDITVNVPASIEVELLEDPVIGWANLQWPPDGTIELGGNFDVFGQVWIGGITGGATAAEGLQAWVGISTEDSDPAEWTTWIEATHNNPVGNNDEFMANIGVEITEAGTYYYATRYQYLDQDFVYGGFSGGFWDGVDNVSGVLTVTFEEPGDPEITFANLQFPSNEEISLGGSIDVYAQVTMSNIEVTEDGYPGLQVWVGYSDSDTDPAEWTNWVLADYNDVSFTGRPEYLTQIGADISEAGTYYFASRFQFEDEDFVFGGFSEDGGGFWDGTTNVSGVLTITEVEPADPEITFANLQFPGSAEINVGGSATIFAQVEMSDLEVSEDGFPGLQVWVGYGDSDSDPSEWTNWVSASYSGISGITERPEYTAGIGSEITEEGIYYYATRFQFEDEDFIFGGFSEDGGGFWNGTENVSGVLTVSEVEPEVPEITFANLQFPDAAEITVGSSATIFAQVEMENLEITEDGFPGLQVWIGYSETDSNPAEWDEWIPANYNGLGETTERPEYSAELGADITEPGTYYFASRFQFEDEDFIFGGYSEDGGGFWDGTQNVSGVLTVNAVPGDIVVTISAEDAQQPDEDGSFTVSLSESAADDVTVSYTVEGTAVPEVDYQPLPGSVTIPAGSTSATIPVTIIPGEPGASNKTVIATLTEATGVPGLTIGTPSIVTLTIFGAPMPPPVVTVWPGDTNNDGLVDAIDVLAIGTYFGLSGPARDDASTEWSGQIAEAWDPEAATYADTDGSGTVNHTDLLAVGLNYGQTHDDATATQSSSIAEINLPALNNNQYIEVTFQANTALAVQGLAFVFSIDGLSESDALIYDLEAGSWADAWFSGNTILDFQRVDGLSASAAYVHRGSTQPVSVDGMFSFGIDALTNWPSGSKLVIERVVFVDANNSQVSFDDFNVEIDIQSDVSIGDSEIPQRMALHQNYPNPFNPTTNIAFDINAQSTVTIEVVNVLGQRVAILADNEDLAPGSYTRVFDANRLPSGMYLIRMNASNEVFTRKMMLVK